ncbi:MAG: VWA domain-containing protein [Planctomycetaceae bacterium]
MERRLPIYLLLDCSESMAGEAIEDVQRGVQSMCDALRQDPLAIETAHLSVISFSGYAKHLVPLTEVLNFECPRLKVRSGTALGSALQLLLQCLQKDVVRTSKDKKADYKPIVILLTDGEPTDAWEAVADQLKQQQNPGLANIYAIACGPDADTEVLHRITNLVLRMKDMSAEAWRALFVWLTASIQTTQQSLAAAMEGASINLPGLPAESLEIAPRETAPRDSRPRQVFLHAFCSQTGGHYLMRFARQPHEQFYSPVASHRLDPPEGGAAETAQSIRTTELTGMPACPYCESPGVAVCQCQTLLCVAPGARRLFCPGCQSETTMTEGSVAAAINTSQG